MSQGFGSQPSSHITDSASYPNPTRAILNLLVVPVSRDLQISDTQMSLLIGVAFAIFYTALGLPLGRVADSHSRRGLIGAGFALWSLFTAGCGFAGNYAQLLVMRIETLSRPAAICTAEADQHRRRYLWLHRQYLLLRDRYAAQAVRRVTAESGAP